MMTLNYSKIIHGEGKNCYQESKCMQRKTSVTLICVLCWCTAPP